MIPLSKDTKLLTICPTYGRPKEFKRMLDSYVSTRRGPSEIIARLTDSDPKYQEYLQYLNGVNYIVGSKSFLIPCTNDIVSMYPGLNYYQLINDDHVYVTEGWDLKLMKVIDSRNGWAISHGRTRNMITAEMFGGKIVSTLGFMYHPRFKHAHVDDWVIELGNMCRLLSYEPNVLIEHMHPCFGLAPTDLTYKSGCEATMPEGAAIMQEWRTQYRKQQIDLIRAAMSKEKTK